MTPTDDQRSTLLQQACVTLQREFPEAEPTAIDASLDRALSGLDLFGLSAGAGSLAMLVDLARRDLRLTLGLDQEIARLDPENHRRRS